MKWSEVLKNLATLLEAALPLVEKKFELLPVNPAVREDVVVVSMVAAAVAGFGAYHSTKQFPSIRRWLGWIPLFAFLVCIGLELAFAAAGLTFGFSPSAVSLSVRLIYVLVFFFLGLAIGAFLGLA
jgi:hypothetical protein